MKKEDKDLTEDEIAILKELGKLHIPYQHALGYKK